MPTHLLHSLPPLQRPAHRLSCMPPSSITSAHGTLQWQGSDEFSHLGDRVDQPPLPLPELSTPKRVVLVRHGQSTWNAEGRIQGSSDLSVLTDKGVAQAQTTRQMVCAVVCCICRLRKHSPSGQYRGI